ncbi:MAG: hypothetical protein QNJ12_13540 [Ilumatobacter sp.]|uniref:hypothetical protein n=1 Tax=Ilumatobacter sp. TaxID=1967498 RepID=UPI00262F4A89|nr:hypothetical protein [Ilumatobacter sp.]MDJ0769819.1 hypothetical protein [Ilumatobacter sp.]
MTQVPWSVLGPTRVEQIVGVLLGREHPTSTRLRPGRGDGGIDVFVPVGDGRVDVFQIKSFAAALTSSQRSQIQRSLRRVADNPNVTVRDWYLTLPLNPTPGDCAWLDEVCADVDFHHDWFDLGQLEGLAAKYQDVVDYYVGDGRARLEATIERLRGLSGLTPAASERVLGPEDLIDPLAAVHELLNRDDPHYHYDFHVTRTHAPANRLIPPTLVASWSLGSANSVITFDIHARYLQATEDRPIPVTFTVHSDRLEGAAAEAWDRMLRYGTPATVEAPAVSDAEIGLPIAAGLSEEVALIRFGPGVPSGARPYKLRMRLIDPNGLDVAETTLDMQPVTRGMTGGWRIHGTAPHDAFTLEVVGDSEPTTDAGVPMRLALSLGPLAGEPPAGLRPCIRFLAAFRQPNRLQFLPPYGPPVAEPIVIPEPEAPITDALADLIEALADLQEHAAAHLVTPEFESLESEAIAAIHRAARLVRGETIRSRWVEQPLSFPTSGAPEIPDGPIQLHLGGDYTLQVGDQTVVLAPITTVLLASTLTRTGGTDDQIELTARPALGNDTRLSYLVSIEDAPLHPVEQGDESSQTLAMDAGPTTTTDPSGETEG